MEKDWSPLPDETPEDYVERVGGWEHSNFYMMKVLQDSFGLAQDAAKEFSYHSRSFWEHFLTKRITGIYQRGGARYAATRFVKKKNVLLKNGSKMFSEEEVEKLIDSVGSWTR